MFPCNHGNQVTVPAELCQSTFANSFIANDHYLPKPVMSSRFWQTLNLLIDFFAEVEISHLAIFANSPF